MQARSTAASALRSSITAWALVLTAAALPAQFSAPIVLPGDTALAPPAGDQTNVAFARGASTSLMVWEDSRVNLTLTQNSQGAGGAITDLYATRVDDAGNALDTPPIHVTRAAFSQTVPKVAWNGQNWLVVWTSSTSGPSFSGQGIYGTRISASGQILDDPPIVIADTPGFNERDPVVASDGNMWAVIWFANIAFGTDGVRGCLVDPAGTPDAPRTFFQTVGGVNYYVPFNFELAWAGGRYLFVSEHMRPSGFDNDIFGQLLDASLTKVGGEFPVSTNTWNQNRAAIASNGTGFFVTWFDEQMWGEVRGSPVSATGTVAVTDGATYATGMYGSYPSPAAGWDGVNWIAAWDSTGPLQVARVSTAGAMLAGSPFDAANGTWEMHYPAIATLASGALVAWSDLRNVHTPYSNAPAGMDTMDLYGAVVGVGGGASPDVPLLLSPPAQTRPDLAGNSASGYLLTFLSETAGAASVMAQRTNALGVPIDPQPIVVTTGTRMIRNPAVAFDGTLWLVTWEELSTTGVAGSADVYARRVGSNGIPIDAAPILVMSGNTPDVAAVGGVFLVVSSFAPGHFRSIHGARVRGSDGAVLDATPIFIGAFYSLEPAVTAFADRWLVAWEAHPSHDSSYADIRASFVLANGTVLGGFIAAGSPSSTLRAPSVTSGGSTALVSWGDSTDIRARRIQSDGTMLDTSTGFAVSNAFNQQFAPDSGWDGTRWFVAWNDFRAHTSLLDGGVGDVYGSRVAADGTVTDPAGLAVASDFRVPEANPAVAGDSGIALSACAMVRDEGPFGTFRITITSLGGSGPGTTFCFGDGTGTACPCGNDSTPGNGEGCASSLGFGAKLAATGSASLSGDTVVLLGTQMPNSSALYIQGTTDQAGGAGVVFGDGLRCVGGSVIRLGTKTNAAGASQYPAAGDPAVSVRGLVTSPGVRTYQCWYRNAAGFCTPAPFNLTNGLSVLWSP